MGELRRQGVDAELVLAGDGELREAIERHCVLRGVADRVRITGWISGATAPARRLRPRVPWCSAALLRACQLC
ncbi:MAG: hypothetical protein R3E42_08735 [Burkholderiaceae bacterium]